MPQRVKGSYFPSIPVELERSVQQLHIAVANAGFLWDWGGQFPCLFTALTGVLGLGETDVYRVEGPFYQPPHQHCFEFARLLLEAGADPNDNQGLYNRMQYPNDEHLKLLFEYGLGKDQGGPWFTRFFQHWPRVDNRSPSDILSYQLRYAVKGNYFDRVKLLVENGADVNRTSQYPSGAQTTCSSMCDGSRPRPRRPSAHRSTDEPMAAAEADSCLASYLRRLGPRHQPRATK
jgi:hypothetical protein